MEYPEHTCVTALLRKLHFIQIDLLREAMLTEADEIMFLSQSSGQTSVVESLMFII